jgi:subtilisin family serine protease
VTLHDITNAEDRAMAIADTPAVKNVWPVEVYGIPEPIVEWVGTEGLKPESTVSKRANDTADTYSTHVMTQVDKMRAKGITGKGVHVAVIDTGVSGHMVPASWPSGRFCFWANVLYRLTTSTLPLAVASARASSSPMAPTL